MVSLIRQAMPRRAPVRKTHSTYRGKFRQCGFISEPLAAVKPGPTSPDLSPEMVRMKIPSHYRRKRDGCMISAVFAPKRRFRPNSSRLKPFPN